MLRREKHTKINVKCNNNKRAITVSQNMASGKKQERITERRLALQSRTIIVLNQRRQEMYRSTNVQLFAKKLFVSQRIVFDTFFSCVLFPFIRAQRGVLSKGHTSLLSSVERRNI